MMMVVLMMRPHSAFALLSLTLPVLLSLFQQLSSVLL
jgi:hypothetical protein